MRPQTLLAALASCPLSVHCIALQQPQAFVYVSRLSAYTVPPCRDKPKQVYSSLHSDLHSTGLKSNTADWALLFDCDGVLADTERDGHRPAFNEAFKRKGIAGTLWSVELYGELLKTGGGKERMMKHWNAIGWPEGFDSLDRQRDLVQSLHELKTQLFMETISSGRLSLRPGILRLVDEAIGSGVPLGVCSTSNDRAVRTLVEVMMGPERARMIQIFAGDIVREKKPAPDIYLLAKDSMSLSPSRTVVIEDSEIGLRAAKAAGMKCIVTRSSYTMDENFEGADWLLDDLGGSGPNAISLPQLRNIALRGAPMAFLEPCILADKLRPYQPCISLTAMYPCSMVSAGPTDHNLFAGLTLDLRQVSAGATSTCVCPAALRNVPCSHSDS